MMRKIKWYESEADKICKNAQSDEKPKKVEGYT